MNGAGPVVAFLEGSGGDRAGRALADVLAFDDAALERHHDFIQWLFPLDQPSGAVPGSPVLTQADIAAIRASPRAQAGLAAAAERMRRFYADTNHWLVAVDHNHLRITRIVRSLRMLAGEAAADAFRAFVLERAGAAPVSDRSRAFWNAA